MSPSRPKVLHPDPQDASVKIVRLNDFRFQFSQRAGITLADLCAFTLVALIAVIQFGGIQSVPFHPDESTYLFMSADFETLLREPIELAFDPGTALTPTMRYRLIDAPLTRYLVGAALMVTGKQPLPSDWDWGLSIAENTHAGALPSESLLYAGRLAVSALLPLTLLVYFLTVKNLAGCWAGFIAIIFLGLNGLTSLHARRVMTEPPLLFGTILFLWALTMPRIRPALLGFALAVAVNSKHTALVLVPVAVLGIYISSRQEQLSSKSASAWISFLKGVAISTLVVLGITFLLNPVVWRSPLAAVETSGRLRAELLQRQVDETEAIAPGAVLNTPSERLVALLGNTFLLEPHFAEVGNYSEWSAEAEASYMARSENNLFRGPVVGAVMAVLFVFGMTVGLLALRNRSSANRTQYALLLVTTIVGSGAVLAAIPFPWQRYVLPLLPLTNLWIAIGIVAFARSIRIPGIEKRNFPQEV